MPRNKKVKASGINDYVSDNTSSVVTNNTALCFEQQKELLMLQAQLKREDECIAQLKREEDERIVHRKREEDERIAQFKREELQMQIELAKMQNNNNGKENVDERQDRANNFNLVNASKRLYKFDENFVDEYIEIFEKMASLEGWPQDKWCAIIQPHLLGKAQKAYNELTIDELSNFEMLKQQNLKII